uniref:JmjC domain-containing protein n=1 Tax=Pyrodinium bahamense TaxID=73915 RepID=A0A7S0FLV2_9DINO|mmetsp:Transcript_37792/g.105160  ORF Transcript_37792/g.105160 Transcript_37792/m.105160 type:complete len:570 (+) Transcript_37792:178-1887(+)|eukprot:CAMPEP_0179074370 /NCGR_PEP_ID=MMETSP0796-20121207/33051_1 /TAXON_ID=73915 /ORGANISM="Pyrodinium bahamense, Strain pbaha01" /LENGTH=569 /DNA_ID=CAMNT_0020771591 /DNA_START=161 /DNA_END=1870 /DNA_ORIENTATION=+
MFFRSSIGLGVVALWSVGSYAQNSINLHAKLSINKNENTTLLLEQGEKLVEFAKTEKLHASIGIFLNNLVDQLKKLNDAAKTVEKELKKEKAVSFTVGKYKLKELRKLRAKESKKHAIPSLTVAEFEKKYSKKLEFSKPFLVKKAAALFKDFDVAREQFTADNLANNEHLEANTVLEYFPPDQPRQKIVGNMLHFTEPNLIPFSRYLTQCYHGTPAAPKIPGQATEHCEQTMSATKMVQDPQELDVLRTSLSDGTPLVDNVFYDWESAMKGFFGRGNRTEMESEIKKLLGRKEGSDFIKQHASGNFRYFVFGPSGSGDKLHAENGLPFYDVLIHGARRWLLLTEEEIQRVAEKAREALEFQQTSAYMFFEEKLPELTEEFGLKSYIEANQEPGDVIFVPSGWFRVSLSLADSISYYEQMLYQPSVVEAIVRNTVWNPSYRQFNLAFCYDAENVVAELKKREISSDKLTKQNYDWIESQLRQVETKDYAHPLMNVLTTCAKILGSGDKVQNLISLEKTKCNSEVWQQCRAQLVKKLAKKKGLTLNWLPNAISGPPPKEDSSQAKKGADEL